MFYADYLHWYATRAIKRHIQANHPRHPSEPPKSHIITRKPLLCSKLAIYNYIFAYVVFCAIQYYLHNLKNVKSTHGGMLLLVKLQAFCRLLNIICFTNWAVTTNTFLCKSLFQGMWLVFYMFFSEAATKDDL